MAEHHKVPVVRIAEINVHPNADKLDIIKISGYQCIVAKGQFKIGDLAIYVYPDSVVPIHPAFEFLYKGKELTDGTVPVKYRRIKARKLRKEWSEGLLMPVTDFGFTSHTAPMSNQTVVSEGDDVAELIGITHYEPPEDERTTGENERGPQYHKWPRSLKGWVYFLLRKIGFNINGPVGGNNVPGPDAMPPVYDVEAFKNFTEAFIPGEQVVVTEKIHGSNARYTFQNGKMYVGSRKLWKSPKAKCIWRTVLEKHPWIEEWCRLHEGYTLFGEVTPTQGNFTYGGEPRFFVFDIRTPDGKWLNRNDFLGMMGEATGCGAELAPKLYAGPFDLEKIKSLVDGPSTVFGASNIREGIVIKPVEEREVHNLGRLQLKIVSNFFLLKDEE